MPVPTNPRDASLTLSLARATGAAASATPAGALIDIVDLPAWNWGQNKSIGVCLGSWLILEKWVRN